MNCRERVLRAIRFETPDRIPNCYSVIASAKLEHGQALLELCKRYPSDFNDPNDYTLPVRDAAHYGADGRYFRRWTDEWGCTWESYAEGIMGEVKASPLADWGALPGYRLPEVTGRDAASRQKARESMARMKERFVGWGAGGSFYEQMQYMRGVEALMMDIAEERDEVCQLADRLMEEWLIPRLELTLETEPDIVGFGDDWGTQQSLLISPAAWRRIFKPRYRRLFDMVRQAGALVWMHSDGMTQAIIEDWIEIGLNVYNPQIHLMDWPKLREQTRGRLCLCPDLDRQVTMPFGTPAQVREHIRVLRDAFADPAGGLILFAPIEQGLPLANIEAALQAFRDFATCQGGG